MNSSVSINRNFWIDTKTRQPVLRGRAVSRRSASQIGGPAQHSRHRTADHNERAAQQPGDHLHPSTGAVEINHVSLYRTFNVQCQHRESRHRRRGGRRRTSQSPIFATMPKAAECASISRANIEHMNESFGKLLGRPGAGVSAGLSAAGGAVPLVGRAVHHHVHGAAGPDRRAHDAVLDAHDVERAVGDGRDLPGRHRGQQRRAAGRFRQQAAQARRLGPQGDHARRRPFASGRSS